MYSAVGVFLSARDGKREVKNRSCSIFIGR